MANITIIPDDEALLNAIDKKLDELVDSVFADSQMNIVNKKIVDEGTLLKSGNIQREFLNKTIIYGVPYADTMEFGRLPGSMPPVDPLRAWIERKGLAKGEKEIGRFAWAIAKDMEMNGTDPRPFLSPAVEMAASRLRSK